MKLHFDEETEAFRAELSAWLDEHAPDPSVIDEWPRSSAHIPAWAREWQRTLFDAGWLVPGNPPEYGGRNATLLETFVHREELQRRRVEPLFNPQGLTIITPSILGFGTDEQIERWAVPILRAEITAALGMSEPDAGSDLAGLRTRAMLDGDHFVVNGQKVWTSGAHDADIIFAFVRTDPEAPKHKGISVLVIPTDLPGVTRRPFGSIIGPDELDFNEVFFDDVHVPAENLIGDLHQGWTVANQSLGHERALIWLGFAGRFHDLAEHMPHRLQEEGLDDDPVLLDTFGNIVIDGQALDLMGYRALAKMRRGMEPVEQSFLKLFGSEASQQAGLAMFEAMGTTGLDPTASLTPPSELEHPAYAGNWFERYLRSFAGTIAGGTSQIQRNIIAERVLGLPRG